MSLSQRTAIRRCGKRWATEALAARSKRVLNGAFTVAPCAAGCGGFHLVTTEVKVAPKRAPVTDTGPSPAVRALVLARDGYACARCGKPCGPGIAPYSLQHRIARGVGGQSTPEFLVLLCGTATTECHGEVESRQFPEDQDRGYRLESWQDPLAEGVMYFEADGSGITRWLEAGGGVLSEPPAVIR